jgi:corrinoid protein of di/trimethylamine methyltransferase
MGRYEKIFALTKIMSEQTFSLLSQSVIDGDTSVTLQKVNQLIETGMSPQVIMDEHLIPAMEEVGRLFEANEYFVPELLISARAMQESMKILNPLLKNSGAEKIGRIVIGTVQGDFHDIGKNLVASMFEGGGFEVIDLGVDVSPEKFVTAVKEREGTIIAMSALLTTTMPQMKKVIEKLESNGLRATSKVLVGGAPVTEEFARQIGADGYSDNASAAVTLAKSFI